MAAEFVISAGSNGIQKAALALHGFARIGDSGPRISKSDLKRALDMEFGTSESH